MRVLTKTNKDSKDMAWKLQPGKQKRVCGAGTLAVKPDTHMNASCFNAGREHSVSLERGGGGTPTWNALSLVRRSTAMF